MNLETILARLKGVRRNGSGWMALCPAHADKNPSLSITEGKEKILLKCFAGCTTEAVCAAAGIEMRDLFVDGKPEPRIVAEYDYLDQNGNLLFQVVRLEPKDFRQRRPDGKGGWTWNLNGTRRVIYRLPQVLAAKSVLVVEGEKDADTARALGVVATCNAGGAGKWREEYSDSLQGKRVCIIADADGPGRKHAQQVAASLARKAESVKVLELHGAKDLSQWAAMGGGREALLELIRNAPEWKAAPQSQTGFILMHLGELLARPDVPVEYLWESRLVAGTVSVVVSKPKVGKSTFARNLTLAVARGSDFLGFKTKQGECIYLALEEREEDVRNDFRAMGADGSEPIYIHAATAPAEGIDALCDLVKQRRLVLVVIDPLFRLARIRDANDYAETYAALGPLIDLARETGTHVMFVHHGGKSEKADAVDSPLGSTGIGGAVCALIVLKRREAYRTIQTVQRIGAEMPERVLAFDTESRALSLGPEKSEADVQSMQGAILEYLKGIEGEKTEPEIDEAVEGKTGLKRKALRALATQGKIGRNGTGKRGDPFRYRFLFSCSQDIAGTREQETSPEMEVFEKQEHSDEKACSRDSEKSFLVPATQETKNLIPQEGTFDAFEDDGEVRL